MAAWDDILDEIVSMDYVRTVSLVQEDGSLLAQRGASAQKEEGERLAASWVVGLGALEQLTQSTQCGAYRHALIEGKEGILLLASLPPRRLLGIIASIEVNRGLLLSSLSGWIAQINAATKDKV